MAQARRHSPAGQCRVRARSAATVVQHSRRARIPCIGLCMCKYMEHEVENLPTRYSTVLTANNCNNTSDSTWLQGAELHGYPGQPIQGTIYRAQASASLDSISSPLASRFGRDQSSSHSVLLWRAFGLERGSSPSRSKSVNFLLRGTCDLWASRLCLSTDPARLGADFSIARRMRSPADGTYDVSDSDLFFLLCNCRDSARPQPTLNQSPQAHWVERREKREEKREKREERRQKTEDRRQKRREEQTAEQRPAICQPVSVSLVYIQRSTSR